MWPPFGVFATDRSVLAGIVNWDPNIRSVIETCPL